jgi:putative FmdB family regulatory protein
MDFLRKTPCSFVQELHIKIHLIVTQTQKEFKMPIFEYKCETCKKVFEEIVHGDRDRIVPCPSCNSTETIKLMSAIGGISMGKATGPCGSSCASASSCAASGGGCCGGHSG